MVYIGTSGFKYPEWKGKFYPEKISPAAMLPFYAARFNTTEVNYTFYRMPTRTLLEKWRKDVPPEFTFSFKAPRRITHDAQLKNTKAITLDFLRICKTVESQLGATLFQLPPSLEKDLPLLEDFLEVFSGDTKVAFEFRHPS
ncbi:MAG: hypothetical protein JWM68_3365, partial [Verrucomicrobiales bacterium]|nr:hypothetical protein [Verrucomicrobiales bacterium]